MTMRFTKMQGLGNDFLVVDRRAEGVPLAPEEAVRLCARRFGVGADGVLSILPSEGAALAMHVTNADGSVAGMCGNGLRCVVRWAVREGLFPPEGGLVETGRGLLACAVDASGAVSVAMGRPTFEAAYVPVVAGTSEVVDAPFDVSGETLYLTALSMGNPHAVAFVDEEESLAEVAARLGPHVERHPRFPDRANAGFARVLRPDALELVVWERGAGLTLACGTGACAAVVAGQRLELLTRDGPVRVTLPGGRLLVERRGEEVVMTGPAAFVFEGVV
jgi:diaminopimelate epimerase